MSRFCPLTLGFFNENEMLKISGNHYVHLNTFKKYICSLNLGIDIDLATEEEWVITARSDTYDNSQTIRLRNPLTNIPFSDNELKHIYHNLTTSNFR